MHSTRPAGRSLQIFPPNLTAHYSAMRVVQVPSLALTPTPYTGTRLLLGGLDTGVRQVQAIRDASLTVPACWQAGWMLVRVRHRPHAAGFDCARLFAGTLRTGSIAVHTARRWHAAAGLQAGRHRNAQHAVEPSGSTTSPALRPDYNRALRPDHTCSSVSPLSSSTPSSPLTPMPPRCFE